MMVEIVERMHVERNRLQVEIMLKWMKFQDQTKTNEKEMQEKNFFHEMF